jgi:hypothetical protein
MKLSLLFCLFAASLAAQPLEVKWSESPAEFAGKRVELKLNNGAKFDGSWIGVTEDSVRFRRSNGLFTYPRSSITQVRIGNWRIRGRVTGTVAAFYLSMNIAWKTGGSGHAILPGMGAGYALGRLWDKKTRKVVFLPD